MAKKGHKWSTKSKEAYSEKCKNIGRVPPSNKGKVFGIDTRLKMSLSRTKEKSYMWKGGRYADSKSGYVCAYCPDHPHPKKKNYVYEHRLVMEQYLGRYLLSNEIVHHINGDRGDNRIENLMLFSSKKDHNHYHKMEAKRG